MDADFEGLAAIFNQYSSGKLYLKLREKEAQRIVYFLRLYLKLVNARYFSRNQCNIEESDFVHIPRRETAGSLHLVCLRLKWIPSWRITAIGL
jgi:hypothetical protein